MADQTQRLEVATVKAEVGSAILYRFANDAVDAAAIPTESGDIRNIKQVILDITTEAEGKLSFASTIYPTTAAGLAATQNGNIFLVRSSDPDEIYIVYENQNGTAVDTGKRALSGSAITAAVASATQAAEAAQEAADDATSRVAGYHSPSATAPSTRDDGTALQIGDTYYNTAENQEYIYKQSGWAVRAIDGSYLSANEGAARVGTAGGTTVQAALNAVNAEVDTKQDATAALGYLSSVTPAANQLPYFNTATGATTTSLTAFGRSLIDDSNATTARTTLGLGNVDNTSDANKPISTAMQAALDTKTSIADLSNSADSSKGAGLVGMDGTNLYSFLTNLRSGALSVLPSVASLRSSVASKLSDVVLVTSHDAGLGYGGGIYRLVPSPTGSEVDNNGTIIITSASKVYRLIQTGPVNIEQFGAIRGSTTDSTAAIQAAINSCTHVIIGDPQAAYQYGFTSIAARSGVKVSFIGGAGLVKIGGTNSTSISVNSVTNFVMEDWWLTVDPSVYTTSISFLMTGSSNIRLFRGRFTGFGSYGLYSSSSCSNITIDGLLVDAVGGKEQLFYWVGVSNFLISRVVVPSALAMKDPIRLHDCLSGRVVFCDIRKTADTFFGMTAWGSVGGVTRDVIFAFNYLEDCRREAITFGGSAKRCMAIFNNLSWPSAASGSVGDFAMSMEGSDSSNITSDCVFAHNTIHGCSLEAIGISKYCQRNIVESNDIVDACMQNASGYNSAIRVYGSDVCQDNIVRTNQITRLSSPNLLYDVSEISPAVGTKILGNITYGSVTAGPTASTSVRRAANTAELETVTVAAAVTGGSGLVATASVTYSRNGRWLETAVIITITTAGTLSGNFVVTMPFTLTGIGELSGHNPNTGLVCVGLAGTGNTNLTVLASNGSTSVYPISGSTQTIRLAGRLLLQA